VFVSEQASVSCSAHEYAEAAEEEDLPPHPIRGGCRAAAAATAAGARHDTRGGASQKF